MLRNSVVLLLGWLCCGWAVWAGGPAGDAKIIASAGLKYLANNQNPDGSYGDPADKEALVNTTAIVLYAMATNGKKYTYESGPFVSDAVDFLLKNQSEGGSFGRVEVTENVIAALSALHYTGANEALDRARKTLQKAKGSPADFEALCIMNDSVRSAFGLPASLTDAVAATAAVKSIKYGQELKNPDPKQFGGVRSLSNHDSGAPVNSILLTALACIVGDRIENNPAFK